MQPRLYNIYARKAINCQAHENCFITFYFSYKIASFNCVLVVNVVFLSLFPRCCSLRFTSNPISPSKTPGGDYFQRIFQSLQIQFTCHSLEIIIRLQTEKQPVVKASLRKPIVLLLYLNDIPGLNFKSEDLWVNVSVVKRSFSFIVYVRV